VRLLRLRVVVGTVLIVFAAVAFAAEPSLEVHLDPRVFGIEDAAMLTVRILEPSGTPVIDLGELLNLEVVSGPSTSSEFSWVNGAATRAVSYTYVIKGIDVGAAALGPVTAEIGDSELISETVNVDVVPGSVVPQRPSRRRSPFPSDPFDDIFGRRQPTRSAKSNVVSARDVFLGIANRGFLSLHVEKIWTLRAGFKLAAGWRLCELLFSKISLFRVWQRDCRKA